MGCTFTTAYICSSLLYCNTNAVNINGSLIKTTLGELNRFPINKLVSTHSVRRVQVTKSSKKIRLATGVLLLVQYALRTSQRTSLQDPRKSTSPWIALRLGPRIGIPGIGLKSHVQSGCQQLSHHVKSDGMK